MMEGLHSLDVNDTVPMSVESESVANVLHDQACLSCVLSLLEDDKSLVRACAVSKHWKAVLDSDAIWQAVYRRMMPQPLEFERVSSYRQQFQRLRGLLDLPAPQPTPLKGPALCYNPVTDSLVSYSPRQRLTSVQYANGTVRSKVTAVEGQGTAHKPLLATTGSQLVVLAAWDGPLELWDARLCQSAGVLGSHQSFVTSLDASGDLAASTCSTELKLWNVATRQCLFQIAIGLQLPSPVLEPHVAVCDYQKLLALANCASPAPSSVVKIYSTQPASTTLQGTSSSSRSEPSPGARSDQHHQHQQQPSGAVHVGSSGASNAAGALLLRELPVNAAADMVLQSGLLLVASCFHGRAVSSNTPYKSERPFTVVVQIWDTDTWQLTRLVSPRLWTDYPIFSMQGMPLVTLTQGILLCATLRSGAPPSCCIHGWQLPQHLLNGVGQSGCGSGSRLPHGCDNNSNAVGRRLACLLSVSPSKQSSMAAIGASSSISSNSSIARSAEPYGDGAMALGRSAVAVAGGASSTGVSASNTIMLAVTDQDRDQWMPLLNDTGGRLTVMLTTPDQLVMATEMGPVYTCRLVSREDILDSSQPGVQQESVTEASDGGGGIVQVADADGRYIDLSTS